MLEEAKNTDVCHTLESRLKQMMGTLLHMEPATIDSLTTFLELGADSLVLVDAIGTIERDFGVKLAIRQLFEEFPHIRALSGYLKETMPQAETKPEPKSKAAPVEISQPVSAVVAPEPPLVPQVSEPFTAGSSIERVMSHQLQAMKQLMNAQLAALSGQPTANGTKAATPATTTKSKPAASVKRKGGSPFSVSEGRSTRKLSQPQQQHLTDLVARYT